MLPLCVFNAKDSMKKVIVFRVENVLVKDYEVEKMFDVRVRKWLSERLLDGFGVELGKVKDWDEVKEKMEGWRKVYEEEGNVEKMIGMRDLGKLLGRMLDGKEKEWEEMRKKFVGGDFEKRKIGVKEELLDLERIGGVVKDLRMVFVSGYGRNKVERLLWNNGLKRFEVVESVDELGEVEKEKFVMFGNEEDVEKMGEKELKCVVGVRDLWKEIGLKTKH